MVNIAGAGLGHSYYGQTSDDLMDPFNEEFETLLNTVATDLKVISEYPNVVGLELMNYYNNCVDKKVHPKEFEANLNPCLIKGDRVHTILTYQLGYLSAVDLDKYKIMYDRNGENHYDMIKRDDAKNLENYNYIKKYILNY